MKRPETPRVIKEIKKVEHKSKVLNVVDRLYKPFVTIVPKSIKGSRNIEAKLGRNTK